MGLVFWELQAKQEFLMTDGHVLFGLRLPIRNLKLQYLLSIQISGTLLFAWDY